MQNASARVVKSVSAVDAGVPAGVHVGKLPAVRAQAEAEAPLATRVPPNWIAQLPPEPGVVGSNPAALTKTGSYCGHRLAPGSRSAVWSYARRNVWIDVADLEQEAALASLEAGQTWQPDGGATRDWYEARAVSLALSRLVAEMRAPVSLPKHHGETWIAAASTRRAALMGRDEYGEFECGHDAIKERGELVEAACEQYEPMEDRLDAAQALRAIHRLMGEESESARAVLLGDEKPATVAKRMGLAVAKVYADTARAMRNLRAAMCPQFVKG